MKMVFLLTLTFVLKVFSAQGDVKSPEDMKNATSAIKSIGINIKEVKIKEISDLEGEGLSVEVELLRPIKHLGNVIPKGTDIVVRNGFIADIFFKDRNKTVFKLNNVVCVDEVALVGKDLCKCKIAKDTEIAKGVIISPPADISFENGKPVLIRKADQDWKLNNKVYKPGYYKIETGGKLVELDADNGSKWVSALCIP